MSYFDILAAKAGAGGGTPTPPPVLIEKSVTENGTYTASDDSADGYSAVTVNVPTGTTPVSQKDVNFIDYDGTIVYSYTQAEFANLDAMPDNPSHDGLTAQGWNWSLSDAKTYVANYGKLNIGQMYITSDGKTRLYITLHDGRLEPVLGLGINGSVDVDWGDGTTHDTMTGTSLSTTIYQQHIYTAEGNYVISLTVTGSIQFNGSSAGYSYLLTKQSGDQNTNMVYGKSLIRIEVGSGVTSIGNYAFTGCASLLSIIIPQEVTSIGGYGFSGCSSLLSIIIPKSVTWITTQVFSSCSSLSSITIPQSVTSIGDSSTFHSCSSLSSITIPQSVTSIGDSAFRSCSSLSSITIPQSVTSIGTYTFYSCSSLSSITIPQSVTSIGANALSNNYGLGKIVFEKSTPPTVSRSSTFSSLPTDCKIYVPRGSLSAYTSAQNYPSSSTYTYIEY